MNKLKEMMSKLIDLIKRNMIPFIVGVALILILIIVLVLMNVVKKEINQFKTEDESFYQYFGTQRFEYDTKLTIDNSGSITELKIDDESIVLDSTPFFYKKEKKVLFPKLMSVVFPRSNGLQNKIPYYSSVDGNSLNYYIKNNNLNYMVDTAFLYDGNDLYFFLTDVEITFGDNIVKIPSFSYATLNYNKELYIFNYDTQLMDYYENVSDTVYARGSGFTVNMSIDAIIYGENSRLLVKNLDYLENLK